MTRRILTLAIVGTGLWVGAVGFAQAQTPPQFRSGIDLTRLDLTVLDRDTRRPIKGLTAEDFVIKVDGRVQSVATLAQVDIAHSPDGQPPVFSEAASDVSRNDGPQPRLFVVVMNDGIGGTDPIYRQAGIRIANRIVDGLDPDDRAAVLFTVNNQHAQDLTSDRTLLRSAISRFNPIQTVAGGGGVLRRAYKFLVDMPGYRRAMFLISAVGSAPRISELDTFPVDNDSAGEISRVTSNARIGHVPIFLFSTHGLHAPTRRDMIYEQGRNGLYERHLDSYKSVARITGGRAIVATNSPADAVPSVFEELRTYYALAYENTSPLNGQRRWLEIEVKRSNAIVMPSRIQIAQSRADSSSVRTTSSKAGGESGLLEALSAPMPAGDLPLRLSSVPLAVPGRREQALVLTLGVPAVARQAVQHVQVELMVFDGEGRREIKNQATDVVLPISTQVGWNELGFRLDLPPGRYQIRLAAQQTNPNVVGSIYTTVTVPDFAHEELSLSGAAIGYAAGPPAGGRDSVANLLPFVPSTARDFAPTDSVGALVRIHQAPQSAPASVLLVTEVIDAGGTVLATTSRSIPADAFATAAQVEHRMELPLRSLVPGSYLLRLRATTDRASAQRDVRFFVK